MLSSLLLSAALALGQAPPVSPGPLGGAYAPLSSSPAATSPPVTFGAPSAAVPVQQNSVTTGSVQKAYPTTAITVVQAPNGVPEKNGNGAADEPKNDKKEQNYTPGFLRNFFKAYKDEFFPDKDAPPAPETPPAQRRAAPEPWSSPPFPGHEYQGYPLIGVPPGNNSDYPLMKALAATPLGDPLKESRINIYGWIAGGGAWSTAKNSNSPTSYWLKPNSMFLDQAVLRFEREADTVQTDHIDYGFRSSFLYGIDYRYMTAGGFFERQLLVHNRLYGFDPTEQYLDVYIPWIMQGMVVRVGRWIACPDIETQFAPDNYMGSHSILFTYDTYTQTGIMLTFRPAERWLFQVGINAGNDMAPWYRGAEPCGFLGLRWVSKDNNDAFYTCLNQINNAQFQHFDVDGQPAGHDNFNYVVSTWEHKFSPEIHTKTEAYFMWQRNAELGGTPSIGPPQSFGGGGGDGVLLPGISYTYGAVNYTMFGITKQDYITVRNEVWRDERGMRSGTPGTYTSHSIGLSHNFNSLFQIRPEIGYYRNWDNDAFDLGTKKGIWLYGFDMTMRF